MNYTYWYDAVADASRWIKEKFSGTKSASDGFSQTSFLGTILMPGVKIVETAQGTIAKDGTIYEDGHPVGRIEALDRQTVITDHLTKKKIFIYDDGAIFGDNGHKLGTITKTGGANTIRDPHGRNITLNQKALKNLKLVYGI